MFNHLSEIAQLITAIVLALNFWQSWRNGQKVKAVATNVQIIEKATNSMKDALVAATAKASLAEGTAVGLAQGRNESGKEPDPVKVEITNMPDLTTIEKK